MTHCLTLKGKRNMKNKVKTNKTITIGVNDYASLLILPFNRPINQKIVLELVESVKRNGQTRQVLLVRKPNNKLYVVDGQHLIRAMVSLNLPIECRIVECKTDTEIVQLMIDTNNTGKKWSFDDFINSWKETGNKDYFTLQNSIKHIYRNHIQSSVIPMAYLQVKRRTTAVRIVKKGDFVIKDRERAEFLLNCLVDVHRFLPPTRQVNQMFMRLMLTIGIRYEHSKMYKNLSIEATNGIDLTHLSEEGIFNKLLKIYNK